ncbi:hypothetical protein LINGRAHAP2_LOCUS8193 [Linum grandiflorum]
MTKKMLQGDQIWAQIPEGYMRVYADLLAHQKVYMVRNFKVKEALKMFRLIDNRFALEFTPAAVVEEIDTANNIPRYKFNFISANQIPDNLQNRDLLWDIVGYVLEYKKPNGARANSLGKQLRLQIEKYGKLMTVMDQIYVECGDKPLVLTITSVFAKVFDGKINESELVVTRPIYSDLNDLANSVEVTLEALNTAILDVQNKENVSEFVGGGNESSQLSFESCVTEQQSSSLKATAIAATSTTNCTAELPSVVTPPTPEVSTDSNLADISYNSDYWYKHNENFYWVVGKNTSFWYRQ